MKLRTVLFTMLCLSALLPMQGKGKPFQLKRGEKLKIEQIGEAAPVVGSALELLGRDMEAVVGISPRRDAGKGKIVVGTADGLRTKIKGIDALLDSLEGKREAFSLKVLPDGRLLIAGSDSHGAAYGVMQLSRLLGVSPWEWWADVTPRKLEVFTLPAGYTDSQSPSVEYRGIFINDEDWGLMPWSGNNYEPGGPKGQIGPKTNSRIFELMLRLRANTYWPAMHECSLPFFLTEGNREAAKKYGIYIGGSHCEPMACNAAGEWLRRGVGEYDYVNNSAAVRQFWEDRVRDVAGQEILYTLGMRGVHDGAMKGAKTTGERKRVLARVFDDQRNMLSRYVNPDVTEIPQVFIPYKEVLDIYNAGLEVPEDVTLMWCDDNYGYIRHFPTEAERRRKGGNGIYYHISYWGRPHDYLWLGTFSPYLLYQQMSLAYDLGIRKIWMLNVGDIKPAEYQIELFMDMAWDIDRVKADGPEKHLSAFLAREFGAEAAEELLPAMNEHYRLAYVSKPEFMANTRTEEARKAYFNTVRDNSWGLDSIRGRKELYRQLSDKVETISRMIPEDMEDAYFQLVKYPVQAAAQMNRKFIDAQMARHGICGWEKSDEAYDSIASLTQIYNNGIHNNGKWKGIMDMAPRKLPTFGRVSHSTDSLPMAEPQRPVAVFNGVDGKGHLTPCENLGYDGGAAAIGRNGTVEFNLPAVSGSDSLTIDVRLLPVHPVDGENLAFSIMIDGKPIATNVSYRTRGRSEEWKMNVLRNQAIRKFTIPNNGQAHTLQFVALTDGVVLDLIHLFRTYPSVDSALGKRRNPILPDFHADPEILYSEKTGKYYIYSTTDGTPRWGGYYFTVFSSSDLVN